MKFALLLLGFASGQDDWEFANKLENPNLSLNLNDIVSVFYDFHMTIMSFIKNHFESKNDHFKTKNDHF